MTAPVSTGAIEAFHDLPRRDLNYRPVSWEEASADPSWRIDEVTRSLAVEPPGEPEADGPFRRVARTLETYEFADPDIIRGVYDPDEPLEGRNMLLEGRFWWMRFHMGVRIHGVVDDVVRADDGSLLHRFGWSYRTLEGHLEEGEMSYQVRKHAESGEVTLWVRGHSRRARIDNPLVRWGFTVFGRRQQGRFYRQIVEHMTTIARLGPRPPQAPEHAT